MAGVRKAWCQSRDDVELVDQYSGRRSGGLTNLIERELGETLESHWWRAYSQPTAIVIPAPFERWPLGQCEQGVGEPVDTRNAGERIVDCGRQRADRDLNDLRNAELNILSKRAMAPDVNSTINRGFKRTNVLRWDDRCEWLAPEHELTGPKSQHN